MCPSSPPTGAKGGIRSAGRLNRLWGEEGRGLPSPWRSGPPTRGPGLSMRPTGSNRWGAENFYQNPVENALLLTRYLDG